jgi:hypothetical protein
MENEDQRQVKKALTTIAWTDAKVVACLEYIKVHKCHVGKGLTTKYELAASVLNATNSFFKESTLTGANLKSKVDRAMVNYEGKFLNMEANKSGFHGDRDDKSNYTSLELLAKSLFEDVQKDEEAKVEAKNGIDDLAKQKAGLEASALGLSNRPNKGAIRRVDSVDALPTGSSKGSRSSTNSATPIPIEDPMGSFLDSFAKSKCQEASISREKWEEEKRSSLVREEMAQRNMLMEERKLKLAEDKLQYDILLLKTQMK